MIYTSIRGFHRSWVREIESCMRDGKDPSPLEKAYTMTVNMWKAGLPEHITSTVTYKNGWISSSPHLFNAELREQSLAILDECGLDHNYCSLITVSWLELTKYRLMNKVAPSTEELINIVKDAFASEAEYKRKQSEQARIKARVYDLAEKAGINLHNMYMSYQAASSLTYHEEKAEYERYVASLVEKYNPITDTLDL
jgi:hypothetical protein